LDSLSTEDQVALPKHSIGKAYQRVTDLVKIALEVDSDRGPLLADFRRESACRLSENALGTLRWFAERYPG